MLSKGQLFIVATPIGNLDDITLRALNVLKSVDFIFSENTSRTQKLLDNFNIKTSQVSYREENRGNIFPKAIKLLENGNDIALVSDSGTPLISDPGFKLVEKLVDKGFEIVSIPGPCALISALSSSSLPTDKFSFVGFLPKSVGKRGEVLKIYGNLDATLIIYESPRRVKKLLTQIRKHLGNRYICITKELTKVHEEKYRGFIDSFLNDDIPFNKKGEFVVLIAKKGFKDL